MRSSCAVYVDAGYLEAAAAQTVTGTALRGGITVNYEYLVQGLIAHATSDSGRRLLRVHWYDSATNGVPSDTHERISQLPHVVLGLGRTGFDGCQKGVDVRFGVDLVVHALKGAVDVMYLVTGDDDLSVAVEKARAEQPGVQLKILAVPDQQGRPQSVSRHLHGVADGLDLLDRSVLDGAVTARRTSAPTVVRAERSPRSTVAPSPVVLDRTRRNSAYPPGSPTAASAAGEDRAEDASEPGVVFSSSTGSSAAEVAHDDLSADDLDQVMDQVVNEVLAGWLSENRDERLGMLRAHRPTIPSEADGALLVGLADALDRAELPDSVRHELRGRFWRRVDEL